VKAYTLRAIFAAAVAVSLGTLACERLFAQTCAPFPAGVVPFGVLHYISAPNADGDRLMVGEIVRQQTMILEQIPLPSFANQKFCGSVEMAPGLFVEAYVPTQQERSGDFSAFGVSLLDPFARGFDYGSGEFFMQPFPGNIVPRDRFYFLPAWRITSSSRSTRFTATLSVPIVLSLAGANNSFYTSELTLANRGTTDLTLELSYTAAFGEGSGNVTDTLPAGRQRILPDAIAYLRSLGLPIPASASNGGTLTVKAPGLASPTDVAVTVRTTTALAEGRAGLAYSGNGMWKTFSNVPYSYFDRPYICGLRQNATDRSNVAVMHAGNLEDGEIVLRLTVVSGDPPFAARTLPDITLTPGGFHQINEVLVSNGLSLSNAYVYIERVRGTASYYAYGVINDQVNSDGSFVPPMLRTPPAWTGYGFRWTVPVLVETGAFTSELVLTNASESQKKLDFSFVAEGIQAQSHSANFSIELSAGQQLILPNFVQYLRDRGILGIGPQGTNYVGALFATIFVGYDDYIDGSGIFIGARTSTESKGGGRFGVFYPGLPLLPHRIATTSAWVFGLQQNSETRTNLALVNIGFGDGNPTIPPDLRLPSTFRIELFDGPTGRKVNTIEGITVDSHGWIQIGSILDQFAPGTTNAYAHVTRITGKNPFIAYAVVNDGALPGERTGDGAFVSMQLDVP
jgi:hypothetical protein